MERSASLAVLLILTAYTIGILFVAPYPGMYIDPSTGRISALFIDTELLHEGDRILQVGSVTWEDYKSDRRVVLFAGLERGDKTEIRAERNAESVSVLWQYPGFSSAEFKSRIFNVWPLAFVFWLAGLTAHLSIRPRDTRRTLFIAANYLTALWLASGSLSSSHLWESSSLLHASSWLMMPVYLHLHWIFPYPFRSSGKAWSVLYVIALFGAAGEFFHIIPRGLFQMAFLIAIGGSFLLLIAHYIFQPQERRTIRLLSLSFALAFLPAIFLTIFFASGLAVREGLISFLFLPFMPLAYFYLIHRRQLGGMETRVNRIVSTYAFLILLGLIVIIAILIAVQFEPSPETWAILAAGISILAIILTAAYLTRFQTFVNQRFFGITLPYQNLPETYSSRIAVSDNLPSLLTLLENEVFPSLLVRQYAFLQAQDKTLDVLLAKDVPIEPFDVDVLTQKAGRYIPNLPPDEGWLRLILPLKVGDKTLGFWLLGRRDPDDLYPQVEIPILQSLADQTAIALSNILQEEQLRSLYQTDIERTERERKSLARDLHDSILNLLADMYKRLDVNTLPPEFLSDYERLKLRLREIIGNLRPPLLDQGLPFALTELVEDIRDKNENLDIALNVQAGEEKSPENIETHIFFIIREACQNVLRHAHAKTLSISGVVSPRRVDLTIKDDGIGLPFGSNPDFHALLSGRHFGLAGMMERANLIGAKLEISSKPGSGTIIRISWQE